MKKLILALCVILLNSFLILGQGNPIGEKTVKMSPIAVDSMNALQTNLTTISQDSLLFLIYKIKNTDSIISLECSPENIGNDKGIGEWGVFINIKYITPAQEEKLDLVWVQQKGKKITCSPALSFNNNAYQDKLSIDFDIHFSLSETCPLLSIVTQSEGGDIDFQKTKMTTFFCIKNGAINELFSIVDEETKIIADYVNGNGTSITTNAEMTLLPTGVNGYKDIKVVYVTKEGGEQTSKEEKIFLYKNGQYVKKT
jgi:hypothetical protein